MSYSLFLDDIRTIDTVYPKTDIDFVIVRSYDACITYIRENGLPEFMSFDNDLGEDENRDVLPDGYAVAKWLVYESGFDLTGFKFNVHSANPVAKDQIEGLLNNYMKFIREKQNSLEVLLEDFSNRYKKTKTNVKTKVKTDISFKERARLGMEMISKQRPFTLEEMREQARQVWEQSHRPFTLSQKRAQALSVKMDSVSRNTKIIIGTNNHNLDNAIKYNLRMYFPKFSEEQINEGLIKIYSIYNESVI